MSVAYYNVITWNPNTSMGLGVQDQIAGSPVRLYPLTTTGAHLVWSIDFTNNAILLDAASGTLALDFQGGKAAAQTPLILSPYTGTPTKTQQWSLLVRPGFITSLANTSLVVDDKDRNPNAGNPVWAYPFNGSPAQQWTVKSVLSAIEELRPKNT